MHNESRYETEMELAISTAIEAGEAVRDLYDRSAAETYTKADGSPVTDADLASDRIIRAALAQSFPHDAILTEEGADEAYRLMSDRVWLADPIDGTRQFVERTDEFDVLIALLVGGEPVVGVLLQPTTGLYLAAATGVGAWSGRNGSRARIQFSPVAANSVPRLTTSTWLNMPAAWPGLSAAAARLHSLPPVVSSLGIVARHFLPPSNHFDSLIGLPTLPDQTMAWEWDFAAADIVVREAGGRFTDAWGRRFRYNKPIPRNHGGVVLSVDPVTHQRVLDAIGPELPDQ